MAPRTIKNNILVVLDKPQTTESGLMIVNTQESFNPHDQYPTSGVVFASCDKGWIDPYKDNPKAADMVRYIGNELRPLDKVYIFSRGVKQSVNEGNYFEHEGKRIHVISLDQIVAYKRNGVVYPHGDFVILEPIYEDVNEIKKGALFVKAQPDRKLKTWIVRYAGHDPVRERLNRGDIVVINKSADSPSGIPIDIDGKEYSAVTTWDIEVKIGSMDDADYERMKSERLEHDKIIRELSKSK